MLKKCTFGQNTTLFMKTLEDWHNSLPYRKTNDDKVGNIILKMLEVYGLKEKFNEVRLRQYWKETMGESINQYTQSMFLKNNKLFIKISSASLRQELSYGKEKIMKIMNEMLGEMLLEEVILL